MKNRLYKTKLWYASCYANVKFAQINFKNTVF